MVIPAARRADLEAEQRVLLEGSRTPDASGDLEAARDQAQVQGLSAAACVPGVEPGPIRATRGWQNETTGRGIVHIETGHGGEIRKAGYPDAAHFVAYVASNFTELRQGRNGALLLIARRDSGEPGDTMVVSLDRNQNGGYDAVTAGHFSRRYLNNFPLLWSGVRHAPLRPAGAADPFAGSPPGTGEGEPPDASGQDSGNQSSRRAAIFKRAVERVKDPTDPHDVPAR